MRRPPRLSPPLILAPGAPSRPGRPSGGLVPPRPPVPHVDRRAALALLAGAALAPAAARAQGFAGLGATADGYTIPDPARTLGFPADHGPHPGFRIEWWYVTATLRAPDGAPMGVQWTLFRQAIAPDRSGAGGWGAADLWLGHAAATSGATHRAAEKFARGGIGQAGVVAGPPFNAWIDDWALAGGDLAGAGAPLMLAASGPGFAYRLKLTADKPLALHGDGGISVKSDSGQTSRYYSQPWYRAAGTVTLGGDAIPVTGDAWLDREWSSQPLAADQDGWDWFSLRLPSGAACMLFRLRHTDGHHYLSGSWITPDGSAAPIPSADIALTPLATGTVAGRTLPIRWRVQVMSRGVDETLTPINQDAWMPLSFGYWEGPVASATGVTGYLEMTGY
jgi:predicted secreted hydrolase